MADAASGASRWASGMNNSLQKIKDGVNRVTVAPGQLAAAAAQKAAANYADAINSGRWAAAVGSVPLEQWKQAMNTTGAQRIASGVAKGQPKYQAFANSFYPVITAAGQSARQMPNNSIEDGLNRVRAVVMAAVNWKNQRR